MKRTILLKESELINLIKRVINEEGFVMKSGTITPMGPGAIKPFSSADGITQRRKPKGKSREMNEYKTKTIGSMPLCCLWGCKGCKWTWGGGQWNPPVGSGDVSAGKYANVAPNKSHKRMMKK
tara:strand:- start:963 stop:1331 length:369 start_codon:yes stop_codon:yes gene_type:complete